MTAQILAPLVLRETPLLSETVVRCRRIPWFDFHQDPFLSLRMQRHARDKSWKLFLPTTRTGVAYLHVYIYYDFQCFHL